MGQINNRGGRIRAFSGQFPWLFVHNGVLLQRPFSRRRAQPTHTNNRQTTSRAVCMLAYSDSITSSDLKSSPVHKKQTTLHVKTVTIVHHMLSESPQKRQDFPERRAPENCTASYTPNNVGQTKLLIYLLHLIVLNFWLQHHAMHYGSSWANSLQLY